MEEQVTIDNNTGEVVESQTTQSNLPDFSGLTLDELVQKYYQIEYQSELCKGRILLAARDKFSDDREFGQWIRRSFGEGLKQRTAHNLYRLAKFFDHTRSLTRIPITAGYIISSTQHEDIAETLYDYAKTLTNPKVKDVQNKVWELKPALKPTVKSKISNYEKIEGYLQKLGRDEKLKLYDKLKDELQL